MARLPPVYRSQIEALRQQETRICLLAEADGRLQQALMPIDSRLIVYRGLPPGHWACLPRGWRAMGRLVAIMCDPRIELMPGPAAWPGEIGVHPALAKQLVADVPTAT